MTPLDETLKWLATHLALSPSGDLLIGPRRVVPERAAAEISRMVHTRFFCRRQGSAPLRQRASGDSGYVAHLHAAARGAAAWEQGYRLMERGDGTVTATDGRITLYFDDPSSVMPGTAAMGDAVTVRLPRVRENINSYRFTLKGGTGGIWASAPYSKIFVAVTMEGAVPLVRGLCQKPFDRFGFDAAFTNDPVDFERIDTLVIDVVKREEEPFLRALKEFLKANPNVVRAGHPLFTFPVDRGVSFVSGMLTREDASDGYGQRRCDWLGDGVWAGVRAGEKTADAWKPRLTALLT